MTLPFGCHCDARWGGLLASHCSACHNTFSGIIAFDKHRLRGKCVDPESRGLVQSDRNYPCFSLPGTYDWGK